MRFSSPVQKGNLIFGFSSRNSGIFFCVDAREREDTLDQPSQARG